MEHAKKLMLVDPADVRNIKRHYSLLDQNISDVLSREDVDDRAKLRLYQSALNKFLINRQSVENELNAPLKVNVTAPTPPQTAHLDTYLASLPTDQKAKVEQLLSTLTVPPAAAAAPTPLITFEDKDDDDDLQGLAGATSWLPFEKSAAKKSKKHPAATVQRKRVQPTRKRKTDKYDKWELFN